MAGFIYMMSNPAFPNLLKIGKSKKDPTTDRVNELNQTGVPEPFKVEYYAFVEDEDYLERVVHQKFTSQRPNKNREFFSVDCVEAIDAIRQLSEVKAKIKYEEVLHVSADELEKFRKQQVIFERERLKEDEKSARLRNKRYRTDQRKRKLETIKYNVTSTINKWLRFSIFSLLAFVCLVAYVDGDNGVTETTEDLLVKVYFGCLLIYAVITWREH